MNRVEDSMDLRILIIGFGPFPGAPRNPSANLALALGRRRRPALAGVRIAAAVLRTSYDAVATELPKLIAHHDPDLVLFFGLAIRSRIVRIERRAVNAASRLHPDAAGATPGRGTLIRDAPHTLGVRAPVHRLLAAARAAGTPARLSHDAGRYICNAALFACLNATRRNGRPGQAAFVHIPRPRSHSPPRGRRGRKRPTFAALVRAGEAVLVALLAAAKRG